MAAFQRLFHFLTVCVFTFSLLLSFQFAAHSAEDESRIWTDKTGKHELFAKFVDIKDGVVRLARPNGDITRIPLNKLSKDDQAYLRERAKKNSTRNNDTGSGNRRSNGSNRSIRHSNSPKPRDSQPSAPPAMNEVVAPVLPGNSAVIRSGGKSGSFKPDPAQPLSSPWEPLVVRISDKQGFFEKFVSAELSGRESLQVLAVHRGGAGIRDKRSRLERIDLASGRTYHYPSAPEEVELAILSPSGNRLLTTSEQEGTWPPTQIDIWDLEGGQLQHVISWRPYEHAKNKEAETILWIDDEHLFTSNSKSRHIAWKVDTAEALYERKLDWASDPVFSPGGNQFAISTNKGIDIYELLSGDHLIHVDAKSSWTGKACFSPSGEKLLVGSGRFLTIYDIASGQLVEKVYHLYGGRGASWLTEEYLLLGNGDVVDVARGFTLWNYKNMGESYQGNPLNRWRLNKSQRQIACFFVPLDAMQSAVEMFAKISDEDLLALSPGAKISLDVQLTNRSLVPETESLLTRMLEDAGMTVEADQPIVLSARMEAGKPDSITYREFGIRGKETKISYTPMLYKKTLLIAGQEVWNSTNTQAPSFHVRLEEGKSIHQTVNEQMKQKASFFGGKMPSHLLKPIYQKPQGSTDMGG